MIYSFTARNVRKACRLGKYPNILCLGHGMHNNVFTDGIKKTQGVLSIITKVRNIVKSLRYKSSDFPTSDNELRSLLQDMTNASEFSPEFDFESEDESDEESSDEDDEEPEEAIKLKSLKLDVVTRWYSQLFMLESVRLRGRNSINSVLQK